MRPHTLQAEKTMNFVVTQELFESFSIHQLRLLLTDEKVELFKELCAGPPSSVFLDMGPQEQAVHLFSLLHPGEHSEKDRLVVYLELLEHLRAAKISLRESTKLLKDFPATFEPETMVLLRNAAAELKNGLSSFSNKVSESTF